MTFISKWRGYLIILLITLIPIVLWFQENSFSPSIYAFTNIGQNLGLIGMTWFAITLVLNTRWRFLEEIFGGLDKVYFAHHLMGALTLFILLFHPLSLVVSYLSISIKSAAEFLIPGADMAINFGRIALYSMVTLIFLTLYVKLPYHIWKFTHQFLGVSFIFASLHVISISSDVSYNTPLRIFMFGVIAVGLYAYSYRMLLHRFLLPKYWFTVSSVKNLNGEINEIILTPVSKSIDFIPGQFIFIRFKNKIIGNEQHPFSVTAKKGNKSLALAIKNLGDFTSKVSMLKAGDKAVIEGPYGKFANDTYSKPSVWIAGGIGITPFISLARSFKNENLTYLFYTVKENRELVYKNELDSISKNNSKFKVKYWISEKQGHINAEYIKDVAGDLNNYAFYLCGPWKMMMAIKRTLKENGIHEDKIHYEEFKLV